MTDMQAHPSRPIREAIAKQSPPPLVPPPPDDEPDVGPYAPPYLDIAPPDEAPHGDPQDDPTAKQREDAPAPDDEPDARELSGKRVVLYLDTEKADGWRVVVNPASQQGVAEPLLYEGNRDEAIRAALDDERNATLADIVRSDPERFYLNSVPASSWAPTKVKPRVTKTTWIVQR